MNLIEKINSLGGVQFNDNKVVEIDSIVSELEDVHKIKIPSNYKLFLKEFGAISFKENVVFQSIEHVPIAYTDGTCPINYFYDCGINDSIFAVQDQLSIQIDKNLFVIAEASPGDKVCLGRDDQKVYFWSHDSVPTKDIFLVANSFDDFIKSLKVRDEDCTMDLESEWFADDF